MKIFKLNEFLNQNRALTIDDLSMYLKKNDKVKIKKLDDNRIIKGTIISINDKSISVKSGLIVNGFQLSGINSEWEIISINGDDVVVESKKHKN